MSSLENRKSSEVVTKGHMEALSDGIFAVAMTLLVLELAVPSISGIQTNSELAHRIFELWPKFLAYLLSFLLSGVVWIQHRFILHHLRRIDNRLIWLNILTLMFVVLLPFSTSLLGDYWQYQTPYFVFVGNFLALLLIASAVMSYGKKSKLLTIDFTQRHMKFRRIVDICMIILLICIVGLSYVNTLISLSLFTVFVLFNILGTLIGLYERGIIEGK